MHVTASVLAIGTELTSGQILNRNASWIAQNLEALGISTVLHETVADDHARILKALNHCAAASNLIFVTGGLGPTSDDFTRNVIASWVGTELVFDETSWNKIVTRLKSRGIRVATSNRQQCYFPPQSVILENAEGTANGFSFRTDSARVWVLPGPPREGQSVWNQHIHPELKRLFPELKPDQLLSWNCLGKSESELGEIVEAVLKGSGFRTGYRAHIPYIEVKVWVPADQKPGLPIEKLEQAIEPWVVSRGKEDLMQIFFDELRILPSKKILLQDNGTSGILSERLGPGLRDKKYQSLASVMRIESDFKPVSEPRLETSPPGIAIFTIDPIEHHLETGQAIEWKLTARFGSERYETVLSSPFTNPKGFEDRLYRHLTELTLKTWIDWLHDFNDSKADLGKTTQ